MMPPPDNIISEGKKLMETMNTKDQTTIENQAMGGSNMNAAASNNQGPRKITNCPHIFRKHYAKGMCASCYRKFGRN
jgi:hypothetical protein